MSVSPSMVSTIVTNYSSNTGTAMEATLQHLGPFLKVTHWLWLLWPPVILALGTFGNLASVCVLVTGGRGKGQEASSPINLYLICLALSDLLALYAGLLRYWILELLSYDLYSLHPALCKIGMWTFGIAWNNSTYLLVALTCQRALSVLWPHRIHVVCTRRTTRTVIVGVALMSALLLAHVPYGYDVISDATGLTSQGRCGHGSYAYSAFNARVWVHVEVVTFALLPFLSLLTCNGLLAWRLAASVRAVAGPSLTAAGQSAHTASTTRKKKASSTTLIVMVMSGTFVVLNLPLFLHLIIFSTHNLDAQDQLEAEFSGVDFFLQSFVMILMFCNFAVNFYLYCLTGTKFRRQFQMLFCGRCKLFKFSDRSEGWTENTPDEF